ncbi:MAG: coproporphyrinogen dehydrogenase HemZ [Lutisporaceae bacterium]
MIKLVVNHDFAMEAADIVRLFYGIQDIEILKPETLENDQGLFKDSDILLQSLLEYNTESISAHSSMKHQEIKSEHNEVFLTTCDLKKQVKAAVKLTMYKLLSNRLNKSYPWGILTGIRPLKIVHELLDKGYDREYIMEYMENNHLVSKEKAELSIDIAFTERRFIYPLDSNKVSIYIGIPFCPTRCHYCSFTSNSLKTAGNMVEGYLIALIYEMEQTAAFMNKNNLMVQTIYIGGGTPTTLSEKQLELLLGKAQKLFGGNLLEFTCEAGRPDTITEGKLLIMKQYGVTRISINPQSMNDETLVRIGRAHTVLETIKSFELARELGFDNINMDIILGLSGEGLQHLDNTLQQIAKLQPESLTVHTMAIKRASIIHEKLKQSEITEGIVAQMMEKATAFAKQQDMKPYYLYRQKHMTENLENIGYCKPGFECIYNIQIIEEKQTNIAFGADAITKAIYIDSGLIKRQRNIKDIKLYIENIQQQIDKKIQLLDELYNK